MNSIPISVQGKPIGKKHPCFIIAEAGVNHNGSFEQACLLIDAAQRAGADAVKFQTWITDSLVSRDAALADYQANNSSSYTNQYEMLKSLELSFDEFRRLKSYADDKGIIFLSTPDEEESANFLADLGVSLFKIGSAELDNLSFLQHVARFGRPMIVSTGMGTLDEARVATNAIRSSGNEKLILLQCISDYPARPADCNLLAMHALEDACGCAVGFSDHTLGCHVAAAAVALGACVVEKHLTLDKDLHGPDHRASATPCEFRILVETIRDVEQALGTGLKVPTDSEIKTKEIVRKKLVASRNLTAGLCVAPKDVCLKRAAVGLPPAEITAIQGRRLKTALDKDEPFTEDILE